MLLGALLGDAGQLGAGLLEFGGGRGHARFEFADALGVAALAGRGALQFDGGGVGAVLRFLDFVLQFVAALGQRVLAGFHGADSGGRSVDLLGERGDLLLEARLLGIHLRHAAGQHHAQAAAQLIAHRAKRSALAAWRLRLFICRVTSSKMSSTRARFCLADSRRSSARRFLVLKRVMPAASSMMARRSWGFELSSCPMRSWPMMA